MCGCNDCARNERAKKNQPALLRLIEVVIQAFPELSDDLVKEWADDPKAVRHVFAALQNGPIYPLEIITFDVVIDPKRSVKDWVEAGNYDHIDCCYYPPPFGYKSDTFNPLLTLSTTGTEPVKVNVTAFSLCREANESKARRIRQRIGLDPIGWEHMAAIAEQYPEALNCGRCFINLDVILKPHHVSDIGGFTCIQGCRGGIVGGPARSLTATRGPWGRKDFFLGLGSPKARQ